MCVCVGQEFEFIERERDREVLLYLPIFAAMIVLTKVITHDVHDTVQTSTLPSTVKIKMGGAEYFTGPRAGPGGGGRIRRHKSSC